MHDDDDTKTCLEYTLLTFIPTWHMYVHMHVCLRTRAYMKFSTSGVFLKCYTK
jgi:hypothetical protein